KVKPRLTVASLPHLVLFYCQAIFYYSRHFFYLCRRLACISYTMFYLSITWLLQAVASLPISQSPHANLHRLCKLNCPCFYFSLDFSPPRP
ncbi:hypothetical protein, partial [Ochrobactrum sp. BTU2]|uniref:hypothetical protein n=1 Tax=Ochrobactrum sp. BTU2 TaxID=2856166 RepID=UPI002119C1A1